MTNLEKVLKEKFLLPSFREGQREIIESIVNKNDTLVFMPTGWGKSLTYQLPGLVLEGLTIVISPLISLMKDQVDKLNELGIRTQLINSTISFAEQQDILNELSHTDYTEENPIKFLYIAPERLNSQWFIRVISGIKIASVAIDEAHCISQWGHDFRPSYMKIKGFLEGLRNPPIPNPSWKNPPIPNPFPQGEKGDLNNSSFVEKVPDYIIDLARDLRKAWTKEEELLWELLRRKQLNWIKFRRQHPFWRYIADFYCDEIKLVIELDWKIHENRKEYDEIRDEIISSYWVQILRIPNNEINNDIKWVLNKILSPLGGKYPKGDRGISFPIIALTATATHKVREDIVERLSLDKYNSFVKWFDRKNIIIIVREISKKDEKLDKVMEVLNTTAWSWIVYCSSRKMVKEVYDFLIENNVKAWMYTWAMTVDTRNEMQNKFMSSEYKVIVATNAFGMWIDKKDIRFVIHYNLPWSIENYYQEVGRAWRDWKKSFWVVLASYQDTKIQEFFIENTYPTKQEVLQFYDYLYKDISVWNGSWTEILKTYFQMSKEADLWNDMKAWSIIKILEKYGIIRRWADTSWDQEFRWRGITLVQEKRKHSAVLIDWRKQDLLKDEWYFKLEQIKRLLFYPTCRKRFILEYFGDEEDLKTLPENCWACDYCIEKTHFWSGKLEKLVPLSAFAIVLDVLLKFDKKFWTKMIANFLWWSQEKKLLEWNMDKNKDYWILSEYNSELILWLIEALTKYGFIERTTWKYPLIWLTDIWKASIKREYLLKDEEDNLQSFLSIKCKWLKYKKASSKKETKSKWWKWSKATFDETLKLFKSGDDIKTISEKRDIWIQTIEAHFIRLYEDNKLGLMEILNLVNFDNLKIVKDIIKNDFGWNVEALRPIKDVLDEKW